MDAEQIRELFFELAPVSVRRLFGGAGIFADGVMFALVADGVIYLKADAHNTPDFERENLEPFAYMRKGGRRAVMSYRRMPDRLYDDPAELKKWARRALDAAQRGSVGRKSSGRAVQNRPQKAKRARRCD
ncbi:MAG: TfoX/Sxy family protein [Pseudorhodoplanes sp.]|nr:TfoX/Sxy family protein [Pseudorhodoplanes sp.]